MECTSTDNFLFTLRDALFPIRKYFYFFKLTFTIKFQNNVFTQKYGKELVFHLFEFKIGHRIEVLKS